jgi:hypothetical protein
MKARRAGFTFLEVQVAVMILAMAAAGLSVVMMNSLSQLGSLEKNNQLVVFVSPDSTKLVATAYTAPFAPPPSYLTDTGNANLDVVNSVSLVQLSTATTPISATVLVQPIGP